MSSERSSGGGARFFDAEKRDRGWASGVIQRQRALSLLTAIDVVGADPDLAAFLAHLDRAQLLVRDPVSGAALFHFRWASGYQNGEGVRIQGVLETA